MFEYSTTIDRTAQPVQEVVQIGFGFAHLQASRRCPGLEIRLAEIVVLAIEFEREAVVLKRRR